MKVKGNIIKARQAFVTQRFGEAGWERVLASLSPDDRKVFGGTILNVGWFDFAQATRLDEAIVNVLGGGNTTLFEEMGRTSARENLAGVHRNMVTPGDPQAFMSKAQIVYRFYYDVGRRTYEQTAPTEGVMTTYEAETFSTADCATVIGWYREALALCGARDVRIEEVQCRARGDRVCQYTFSWR
jgi:uncharacterized protein (TIGR02265 family)